MSSIKNKTIAAITAISGILILYLSWDMQTSILTSQSGNDGALSVGFIRILVYLTMVMAWVLWIFIMPYRIATSETEVKDFKQVTKALGAIIGAIGFMLVGFPMLGFVADVVEGMAGSIITGTVKEIIYFTIIGIAILAGLVYPWYVANSVTVKTGDV
jgi:hypothetical protein